MTKMCAVLVLFGLFIVPAGMTAASQASGDQIKVEIRGTLETGVVAIGGETTGTVIRASGVTWELDLGGNKDLQALAEKLNRKTVVVTGTYRKVKGVEIPERHIVRVMTLKPAD
ncbi:MAG: hypothetical protein EPO35_11860 [Acidobacteria bacterium]|nr:MAG: hypothetical protein EPO35_11860 [Acidobacteriota bacterium]